MIRIEALRLRAGEFTLAVDEFAVETGEYVIVLGPTASGKTLLLETVAGLRRPQSGRIWFDGRDVSADPPERRGAGLVYQDYALFPHLTVSGNIGFGLAGKRAGGRAGAGVPAGAGDTRAGSGGVPAGAAGDKQRRRGGRARVDKVKQLAELLQIGHLLDRYPEGLSGGEKQRVALARALATEPDLLLLDEPLSALDGPTRIELRRELKRLHRELGATIVHVTHDLDEAMALGERMAVMVRGTLRQVGTPTEVTRHPADNEIAALVGIPNVFEVEQMVPAAGGAGARARLRSAHELLVDGMPGEALPGRLFAVVRAEEIDLVPVAGSAERQSEGETRAPGSEGAGGRNRLVGVIRSVQLQSVHALVEVQLPAAGAGGAGSADGADGAEPPVFTVDVLRPQVDKLGLGPELRVCLEFETRAVHLCGSGAGR